MCLEQFRLFTIWPYCYLTFKLKNFQQLREENHVNVPFTINKILLLFYIIVENSSHIKAMQTVSLTQTIYWNNNQSSSRQLYVCFFVWTPLPIAHYTTQGLWLTNNFQYNIFSLSSNFLFNFIQSRLAAITYKLFLTKKCVKLILKLKW